MPLVVTPTCTLPDADLGWSFARGGGPGGQNVNKVSSKAILHFAFAQCAALPLGVRARFRLAYGSRLTAEGALVLASDQHRDQAQNMRECEDRLRAMIQAVWAPPVPRKKTKPTRGSVERRLRDKRGTKEKKARRGGDVGHD